MFEKYEFVLNEFIKNKELVIDLCKDKAEILFKMFNWNRNDFIF